MCTGRTRASSRLTTLLTLATAAPAGQKPPEQAEGQVPPLLQLLNQVPRDPGGSATLPAPGDASR